MTVNIYSLILSDGKSAGILSTRTVAITIQGRSQWSGRSGHGRTGFYIKYQIN